MNPNPKFIDITFTGNRLICFVMQDNGKFYTYFSPHSLTDIFLISIDAVNDLLTDDTDIIHIRIHN